MDMQRGAAERVWDWAVGVRRWVGNCWHRLEEGTKTRIRWFVGVVIVTFVLLCCLVILPAWLQR